MFQRVIVPLDSSEVAEKALDYGAEIARRFGARLVLLTAYAGEQQSTRMLAAMPTDPVGGAIDPQSVQMMEDSAKAAESDTRGYLEGKAKDLTSADLQVDTVMVDDSAADAILTEARREPETLVVMCTHGRGGLSRLVFGSTAQDVLRKIQTPLLLVRVYENPNVENGGVSPMDVSIGADVVGTTGKLGEVHRVIVDARTDTITGLVVKHGFLFGNERILPLDQVKTVENGVIHVDMDEKHFEILDGYADDRFRSPDVSYMGPPGFNNMDFLMDVTVAEGPMMGMGGGPTPPMGFPGGAQITPDDMVRPDVSPGTPVLDSAGEHIGDVHEMSFASDTGAPTRLVVRSGKIFHHDTEVPANLIKEISDDGVMLSVGKSEVEKLRANSQ
ncbi:MAG: universal stress protein [Dehalococcoidia bacterium]